MKPKFSSDKTDMDPLISQVRDSTKWKWLCLFLVIMVVGLALTQRRISFFRSNPGNDACPRQRFDYLLLNIRWPHGVCSNEDCVPNEPDSFQIHGLWPNYDNGTWPQFCCRKTPFDMDEISSLRDELEVFDNFEAMISCLIQQTNWRNLLLGKSASSLWAHEWDKHGTCSTASPKIRGELNYFSTTLHLFGERPVFEWLKDADIVPSIQNVYSYKTVKSVIQDKIGKNVVLQCNRSRKPAVLDSLEFCFDKMTLEPKDCPQQDHTCGNGFYFLPSA